jgi:hypothetical protein
MGPKNFLAEFSSQIADLTFKKTMSDSKVPPILVRSGEKMNFTIEKILLNVIDKKNKAIVLRHIKRIILNIGW